MEKPEIIRTIQRGGVELRQRGRSYWANCPFHDDKTPSLKVDPARLTGTFGGAAMTLKEELHRKALLHDQAATLFRQEADRHESEAKRLREEAARLEELGQ